MDFSKFCYINLIIPSDLFLHLRSSHSSKVLRRVNIWKREQCLFNLFQNPN